MKLAEKCPKCNQYIIINVILEHTEEEDAQK